VSFKGLYLHIAPIRLRIIKCNSSSQLGDATSKGTQSLSKIARLKGEVHAKIKVREVMVFVIIITGLWQNKPSFIAYPNRKEKTQVFSFFFDSRGFGR
jgi:hypothetical protein